MGQPLNTSSKKTNKSHNIYNSFKIQQRPKAGITKTNPQQPHLLKSQPQIHYVVLSLF